MNKLQRVMIIIVLVLAIIDTIGYYIWEYDNYVAYAYEFNVWKYKITYNPVTEEEILPTFTETHVFDMYVKEYNKQDKIKHIVAKLGYGRIGIINIDNNYIYTIYINKEGEITKVVDGFDDVDFIAELSINKIQRLVEQNRFEDINQEIKLPFKVKLKILKVMWF